MYNPGSTMLSDAEKGTLAEIAHRLRLKFGAFAALKV
jgi:hypothetical protein